MGQKARKKEAEERGIGKGALSDSEQR